MFSNYFGNYIVNFGLTIFGIESLCEKNNSVVLKARSQDVDQVHFADQIGDSSNYYRKVLGK